jgi:hypothetical protein
MHNSSDRIPLAALVFGVGGLIPFAALAIGIVAFPEPNLSYFLGWLTQYGALIASFIGALQWGMALTLPMTQAQQTAAFAWSVCPALIAWIALQLPQYEGCYLLAALFLLCLWMDARFARTHAVPRWYMKLRIILTSGAFISLAVASAVLAGVGSHH